jgi:hypothetical protein
LRELIQFYAPDWGLVFIWCAIAIPACVVVLWMGRLFGRPGALISSAVLIAGALLPWTSTNPTRIFYELAFSIPLIFGALLGLVVWYVWLGRVQYPR